MTTKNLKTWIEVSPNSDFTIHNIPFGIYTDAKVEHHVCSAIGDYIIDLFELESLDLLDINRSVLAEKDLRKNNN
jgi:fumarylacetoacetase